MSQQLSCKTIHIPYDEATGVLLKRLPRSLVNVTFSYPNNLFNNFVTVNQMLKSDATPGAYTLLCNGCDRLYVGQTGRNLQERLS